MVIKKFLHSCILIEDAGARLLIDPGVFSFIDGTLKPEDIGPVGVVIITHKHRDHYSAEALRTLYGLKPFRIISNNDVGAMLARDGFQYESIPAGEERTVGGFAIKALLAPHEIIPTDIPDNTAYLINDRFLHTGDSLTVPTLESCEILALPVTAPWLKLIESIEFAYRLHPKVIIPIHDWITKDTLLEGIYEICRQKFEPKGMKFVLLKLGEILEV